MSSFVDVAERQTKTEAIGDQLARHELLVDSTERHATVVELARRSDDFAVHIEHLAVGDYWIDRGIVVERKSYADFALSLVDGRLFPQAAKLARCPHRPVVLLEGPRPLRMPQIHPHALKGAMASLAVVWRLPVLVARDPEDSLRIFRLLAGQIQSSNGGLKRYDRKPKRVAARKLYVLQGLPGVGPALAHRLLVEFGSVERVMTAEEEELMRVRGVGRQKAARIRDLLTRCARPARPFLALLPPLPRGDGCPAKCTELRGPLSRGTRSLESVVTDGITLGCGTTRPRVTDRTHRWRSGPAQIELGGCRSYRAAGRSPYPSVSDPRCSRRDRLRSAAPSYPAAD
jgi:DNA excision repair protein ERCC-4